jgi:lipopolysaccharide export system ATP-binding protein
MNASIAILLAGNVWLYWKSTDCQKLRQTPVVNGVSFHVDRGEVVGLLGPNGAGKTTTFRMTIGMVCPGRRAGRFLPVRMSPAGLCTNEPGWAWAIFRRNLPSSRRLTVEQNILAILEAMPPLRSLGRRLTRQERWQLTLRMLEKFNLLRVRKTRAWSLSGGEKRRLEVARCLVTEPLLILLDEPFTGIDPITIADIQNIVRQLRDQGIGILLTDHNVREALKITDRSYVITDGVVEAHGSPEEIIRHPKVIAKYLGQSFAESETLPRAVNANAARPGDSAGVVESVHDPGKSADSSAGPTAGGLTNRVQVVQETSPAKPSSTDSPAVLAVLRQERLRQMLDWLLDDRRQQAEQEFLQAGHASIPVLLEALERRNPDLRKQAHALLERLLARKVPYDPFAPEAERRRALARLREQFFRLAG